MKLRVGLVGLGNHWDNRYRPALKVLNDRFEVRAVCDPVAMRAEQAAKEFGATAVDGFRALMQRPDLEAVLILSESWFGTLPILAACTADKAVYCAMAPDVPLPEALSLKHRVEETGVAFMIELPRRHAPATIRLKELIATQLGQPRILFCHLRRPAEAKTLKARDKNLVHQPSTRAELLELVDWCRYVVGTDPQAVTGMTHHLTPDQQAEDYQMMSLDFSPIDKPGTKAVAQISCGRYVPASWSEAVTFRPPAGLQVACEHGIAFVDLPSTLIWFDEAGRHFESLESERPVGEQVLSRFYRAVTSLVSQTSGMDDAYRALQIVLTARDSHLEGRRIPLI